MVASMVCAVCGVEATQICSGCKNAVYCSKEHQKSAWKKGHKEKCKCFEIAKNDVLGRYMRATRDIKQGEVILREKPLIFGPKTASVPLCLGCHKMLPSPVLPQRPFYKCSKCAWPMCSAKCEISPFHIDECELMTARNYKARINCEANDSQGPKKESAYCVILPLRCILMKENNPQLFKHFCDLEDNLNLRLASPLYKVLGANLITFVKTILGLKNWTEEDIMRVAAILDTNAFEVRQPEVGRKIRAIYPTAAMISHDCISNARHTFDENMQIIFIAKNPIAKGETIATSYTQPLKSTLMRRLHLRQAKCFDCLCTRCSDPTELGLFVGSILCSECKVGKIISTNPFDYNATWKCQLCPHEIPAKQILHGNEILQKEIESLNKCTPEPLENLLHHYRDLLHDTNTHVLQIKYALTQLYGNAPGYSMQDTGLVCSEMLKLLNRHIFAAAKIDEQIIEFVSRNKMLYDKKEYGFKDVNKKRALWEQLAKTLNLDKMTSADLHRKVELCQELLAVATVLDAGSSVFRGNILIDLQEAILIQAQKEYLSGSCSFDSYQESAKNALDFLKEASEIMKFEPGMQEKLKERIENIEADILST